MLRPLVLCLLLLPSFVSANDQLIGVWQSAGDGMRLDILDGFKPNRGAVLSIEKDTKTRIGSWETKELVTTLTIGWASDEIDFRGSDSFIWRNTIFNRSRNIVEDGVTILKEDQNAFVDKMSRSVWLTSTEGEQAIFKSTFSVDSGVLELYTSTGELKGLEPWGISSGVLKIDDHVLVEARISESYLIGRDHDDSFVVYLATRGTTPQGRIELARQREEFLSKLLTDTWQRTSYGGNVYYKFRNVEGPLKGRVLRLENEAFAGASVWEYSPATGALKIDYTDYISGLVIGDTLALLEENGEQTFYQQRPNGPGRTYSMSDVSAVRVNETELGALRSVLDGQFQLDGYLYSFEFKGDGRTGYVHKWRSDPFTVVGQQISAQRSYEAETVYSVGEFLVFDGGLALKRDARASHLRPKTDTEVVEDQHAMEAKLETLGETSVVLRITDIDGNVSEFALPYRSMAKVSEIQFIGR